MPIYEYECQICGWTFERLVRSSFSDEQNTCPNCGRNEVKRLISPFGTIGAPGDGGRSSWERCAPTGG